jgi:hypothetical protein
MEINVGHLHNNNMNDIQTDANLKHIHNNNMHDVQTRTWTASTSTSIIARVRSESRFLRLPSPQQASKHTRQRCWAFFLDVEAGWSAHALLSYLPEAELVTEAPILVVCCEVYGVYRSAHALLSYLPEAELVVDRGVDSAGLLRRLRRLSKLLCYAKVARRRNQGRTHIYINDISLLQVMFWGGV